MELVERALVFAAEKHSGKKRKGTKLPYIIHPAECVAIAASITDDEEIMAAAALHDTVEDTDTNIAEIERLFGKRVALLVSSETEDKMVDRPASDTWLERKQATLTLLSSASRDEMLVVLADKLSNIRSMRNDYDKLGDELWARFNQPDKDKQAWYYRGVSDALSPLHGTRAYLEFREIIAALFDSDAS